MAISTPSVTSAAASSLLGELEKVLNHFIRLWYSSRFPVDAMLSCHCPAKQQWSLSDKVPFKPQRYSTVSQSFYMLKRSLKIFLCNIIFRKCSVLSLSEYLLVVTLPYYYYTDDMITKIGISISQARYTNCNCVLFRFDDDTHRFSLFSPKYFPVADVLLPGLRSKFFTNKSRQKILKNSAFSYFRD